MSVREFDLNYHLQYLTSISTQESTSSTKPELHQLFQNALDSQNPFDLTMAAKTIHLIGKNDTQLESEQMLNKIDHVLSAKIFPNEKPETPDQIRTFLTMAGILPSPEKAKDIFWSLGENWWKQIIDGSDHQFGNLVYDEGLHNGPREPGYLNGIENASKYFTANFDKKLDVALYRGIHHEACAHFQGSSNSTLFGPEKLDLFRSEVERCISPLQSLEWKELDLRRKRLRRCEMLLEFEQEGDCKPEIKAKILVERAWLGANFDPSYETKDSKELEEAVYQEGRKIYAFADKFADELNVKFSKIAERLSLSEAYVSCWAESGHDNQLYIDYKKTNDSEEITSKLFEEFNNNLELIQKACYEKINSQMGINGFSDVKDQYQRDVIPLIARLYDELELAHPWIDGQGRTDLILLSGLLSREGLHPCILNEPYFSTGSTLDQWVAYLQKGLNEFEHQFV